MNLFEMHRKAIESQYRAICDIYEHRPVQNPKTKISSMEPVLVNENIPCKLSYESITAAGTSNGAAQRDIAAKLFIAPEIEVKAGSKLVVTQDGITKEFAKSGEPGIYPSHQEIMLKLFERWA